MMCWAVFMALRGRRWQWARAAAGPLVEYGAALLLALAGAATILLVVAASTQHVPLYSPATGLHVMSAGCTTPPPPP